MAALERSSQSTFFSAYLCLACVSCWEFQKLTKIVFSIFDCESSKSCYYNNQNIVRWLLHIKKKIETSVKMLISTGEFSDMYTECILVLHPRSICLLLRLFSFFVWLECIALTGNRVCLKPGCLSLKSNERGYQDGFRFSLQLNFVVVVVSSMRKCGSTPWLVERSTKKLFNS